MTTIIELRKEIKALRQQVAKMAKQQEEREDKVVELFERIEPFFPHMSETAKRQLEKILDEEENSIQIN